MKIITPLLIIGVMFILTFSCSSQTPSCGSGKELSLCDLDRKRVKAKLLEKAPLGSSIANAEKFMKNEGFKCETFVHSRFPEYGDDTEGKPINGQEEIDGLFCSKTVLDAGVSAMLCKVPWEIAIVTRDNSVKDILIRYRHICA